MGRGRLWTDARLEKAEAMQKAGMCWQEVANAYGVTMKSLHAAIQRHRQRKAGITTHKDTSPIALCPERQSYEVNAKIGSAKLLAEIARVFPERIAA